jgi:hypothetical protein
MDAYIQLNSTLVFSFINNQPQVKQVNFEELSIIFVQFIFLIQLFIHYLMVINPYNDHEPYEVNFSLNNEQ